jgi:hypothetical protein
MRLFTAFVLSLFFVAETQAGWLCPLLHRRECPPLRSCPQFYYDCPLLPCPVPCPSIPLGPFILPSEDRLLASEEPSGGNIPLFGYLDYGIPPTGHDTYFGGGTLYTPINFFLTPPPSIGFGGFGFGGGFGGRWGGGTFTNTTIINNYYYTFTNTTIIDYGDTITNPICDKSWCNPNSPGNCDKSWCDVPHLPCDDPHVCKDHPPVAAVPAPAGLALALSAAPCGLLYWWRRKS